jgi:1-aminocyclopropane-1-carboxylate deaminase
MEELVSDESISSELILQLDKRPRANLAQLPTPLHPLRNFSPQFHGQEIWIKRDDLTGLEGGGNKTRKLEYLVGDALESGYDMLVTIGAIQSNHTRQTAAAAAKCGLKCALLHFGWAEDAGPHYRTVGNILLSHTMGAELYVDETPRPIEDQGPLEEFCEYLRDLGHRPYLIPGGASEHRLGSFGYMNCAAEIVKQSKEAGLRLDYLVHCTGSSSTQSGLLAGFAALGEKIRVVGIADDHETSIKKKRVLQLANAALEELDLAARVNPDDVVVLSVDQNTYGKADEETRDAIRLLAETEGLIADPIYEAKAVRGLLSIAKEDYFRSGSKILLMHLGGSPAIHAYANQFGSPNLKPFPS